MDACYAPLLLWGPLLVVVAISYYRRRLNRAGAVDLVAASPDPLESSI
ncbi:hypothetical protein ACFC1R_21015 [Kitasatospora sp. NPDC056138]